MRGNFEFSAHPKTVKSTGKYRDSENNRPTDYQRIANDPRVQQNYGSNAVDYSGTKGSARSNVGKLSERNTREENNYETPYVPLTDRKIQDEATLIKDYYVDRAPTPEYKPMEPGVEVATQVEDHELFDFQLEVEPILQVLVGKTLEQSQLELREEDEKLEEIRHRTKFERVRNAELMVVQRKEDRYNRGQEEKRRREKQYLIEKQDKIIAHQKYISRLLAKHVTFGIGDTTVTVLADQDVLRFNLRAEMNKEYLPILYKNALVQVNGWGITTNAVQRMREDIEKEISASHAKAVETEVARKKKIVDDAEAERARKEAERKRRRERRRRLRIYCEKVLLLEKIQANILTKPQEIENIFSAEITDIFPAGKESVAIIGGLFGELWLLIDTFQKEYHVELSVEELAHIFVGILNDKLKTKEFNIYLHQDYQSVIQETLNIMSEDLIAFNHAKLERIEELANQLEQINLYQNLGTLYDQQLLDHSLFKKLNRALLYIFFTSVDYKHPEKKGRKLTQNFTENSMGDINQLTVPETLERKVSDVPSEGHIGSRMKLGTEMEDEENKIPEVTPFEQAAVQAKKKLKFNFVPDWEFRKDCDAVLRLRVPFVKEKEIKPSRSEIEDTEGDQEKDENAENEEKLEKPEKLEVKKVYGRDKDKKKEEEKILPKIEVETLEEKNERLRNLVENEEPIEAFDSSTFVKERLEFKEMNVEDHPVKIYNASLVENQYIVQINERAQKKLRKELIGSIKNSIPHWKESNDETMLLKADEKYKKNEKTIIAGLIVNPETIPIFDVENI